MRSVLARVGASVGILGALLLSILAPARAAGTDPVESAVTAEQIAAQLERDPVFVQQVAGGGDVKAARALVRRTIEDLPFPVYVVAGRLPVDATGGEGASTLAFSLRRLLGKDAVFAIAPLQGVSAVVPLGGGMPEPPRNYEDRRRLAEEMLRQFPDDFEEPHGDGPPISEVRETALAEVLVGLHGLAGGSMSPDQVRHLAGQRFLHVVKADPDGAEPTTTGGRWMVGSTVGLLVLVWSPRLLRTLAGAGLARLGRRESPAAPAQDWAVDPSDLEQRRSQLSRRLSLMDPARVRRPDLYEAALLAKQAADTCAESESERDRLGALTLVQQGLHAARGADSRSPVQPWRPCFLNPLHGRAGTARQWVFGDAEIRVPLCRGCARRLDRAEPPQPLLVRDRRRTVPYFEVADVWGRTGYGSLIDDYPTAVLAAGPERDR